MSSARIFGSATMLTVLCTIWTSAASSIFDGRVEQLNASEAQIIINQISTECDLDTGVTADIKTENGQKFILIPHCSISCFLKRLGIVNHDNRLDREGLKKLENLYPDPKLPCTAEAIHEKCAEIKGENECDYGWNATSCIGKVCGADFLGNARPKD